MHALITRRVMFPERRRLLEAKKTRYARPTSRQDIEDIQVARFNATWAYCLAEVPFYRAWREEHDLPRAISCPTDLRSFPVLDKQTFLNRTDEIFQHGAITSKYQSGGSTGVSARYPRHRADDKVFYANTYLGRSWAGIAPLDPSVLIWSHDHLFGTGITRMARKTARRGADYILNITRLNAYSLTEEDFRSHYESLLSVRATYLIGYTLVLTQLARYIERNGLPIPGDLGLRAVILTAETVTDSDVELMERVFKVPCVIEYGAGETGVIAASCGPTLPLRVFWDSFICLTDEDGALNITTLDKRLFPLINYAIGDRVEIRPGDSANTFTFHSIVGRLKDLVYVAGENGESLTLSCRLPVHILKTHPGIIAYQFDQRSPTRLHVLLQASHQLDLDEVAKYFSSEMARNHFAYLASSVSFEQVPSVVMTLAGKHSPFVTPSSVPAADRDQRSIAN